MTIENAIKRLLDSEQELSYSQRIAIADLLEQLVNCIDYQFNGTRIDRKEK